MIQSIFSSLEFVFPFFGFLHCIFNSPPASLGVIATLRMTKFDRLTALASDRVAVFLEILRSDLCPPWHYTSWCCIIGIPWKRI